MVYMQINSINFNNSLEGVKLNLKVGQIVEIEVLKMLKADTFLVNIKGNTITAIFKNPPPLNKIRGLVIMTEPNIEIKVSDETHNLKQNSLFKTKLMGMDLFSIKQTLLQNSQNNLKNIDTAEIRKFIENTGIFFESKILSDKEISNDSKFIAIKNGDEHTRENITKLQITSLLNQAAYFVFKSDKYNINESEILLKRMKKGFKVFFNLDFTTLGQVIVEITQIDNKINAVVKSEEDIGNYLAQLNNESFQITWRKKEETDSAEFEIVRSALKKVGNLQVYA